MYLICLESQVLRNLDNPSKTYKSNIFGTLNLFDSLRILDLNPIFMLLQIKCMVFQMTYYKDHKLSSNFTYDVSKISADFIAQNYKHVYKQNITIFNHQIYTDLQILILIGLFHTLLKA